MESTYRNRVMALFYTLAHSVLTNSRATLAFIQIENHDWQGYGCYQKENNVKQFTLSSNYNCKAIKYILVIRDMILESIRI